MQITRFLDVNPNAKPSDVLKWVFSHSPNPWPQGNRNAIKKNVARLRVSKAVEQQNSQNRDDSHIALSESRNNTNIAAVRRLLGVLSSEERDIIVSELDLQGHGVSSGITTAIKDIIHYRSSKDLEQEALRSTVISACCGPDVTLKELSNVLGIYGNRNYFKLNVYRRRREAYLAGHATNLSGERYASQRHGYPEDVMSFLTRWFVDDCCSTPDRWGRKVYHINDSGLKVQTVIRHMKAADRWENHKLFVSLRGEECRRICSTSLRAAGRKLQPRIPGSTLLESCRPNFVKYFQKYEFGDCSLSKPSWDNYPVFVQSVQEASENIKLPETVSTYVRSRIFVLTHGDRRHECEENRCRRCSFINYFIDDPKIPKNISKKYSSLVRFEQQYNIELLLGSDVEWREHEVVGDELPGKRKYAHLIYKSVRGTLADFLLVFQRACIKMKPHKFYHRRRNERKLLAKLSNNSALTEGMVVIFADYCQNLKKMSTTSGIAIQYRDMPDFSLLNIPCFIRHQAQIIRFDYHCISDDPKNDTCL